jgi:hypothetical protein|eukprot:COSAG02_NODE_6394_length_3602_cov_5.036826_3_plen_87_part_00
MLTMQHRDSFYPRMRSEFARMAAEVNDCMSTEGWDCHMVSSDDRAIIYFQVLVMLSAKLIGHMCSLRPPVLIIFCLGICAFGHHHV